MASPNLFSYKKSNRIPLAEGRLLFVWFIYAIRIDTTIPRTISIIESISKSLSKLALLSQIFLCRDLYVIRESSPSGKGPTACRFSSSTHKYSTKIYNILQYRFSTQFLNNFWINRSSESLNLISSSAVRFAGPLRWCFDFERRIFLLICRSISMRSIFASVYHFPLWWIP